MKSMAKITWRPGTMLSPLPPALITSGDMAKPNVMTAAWTGIICSDPVITYVSIRPSRYTHELISQSKEFVINIPTWKEAAAVDTVGVKSGRELDKFALTGLKPIPSTQVNTPQIEQCPISIECKVKEIRSFGTHDMFLAEVVAVNVDEAYVDKDGALDLEKAGLLAYAHGFYYTLGRKIGKFGYSVEEPKKASKSEKKTEVKVEVKPEVTNGLTSKTTHLKADEKFSKAKREEKFRQTEENKNGVKVVVKKSRFAKPQSEDIPFGKKSFKKKSFDDRKPRHDDRKPRSDNRKPFEKRGTDERKMSFGNIENRHEGGKKFGNSKFSRKDNKRTSYQQQDFHKKSDGSFKRKSFKKD